jgi:hypothetical protein
MIHKILRLLPLYHSRLVCPPAQRLLCQKRSPAAGTDGLREVWGCYEPLNFWQDEKGQREETTSKMV